MFAFSFLLSIFIFRYVAVAGETEGDYTDVSVFGTISENSVNDKVAISKISNLSHHGADISFQCTTNNLKNHKISVAVYNEAGEQIGHKEDTVTAAEMTLIVPFQTSIGVGERITAYVLTDTKEVSESFAATMEKCMLVNNYPTCHIYSGTKGISLYYTEFRIYEQTGKAIVKIDSHTYEGVFGTDGYCDIEYSEEYMEGIPVDVEIYCNGGCLLYSGTKKTEQAIDDDTSYQWNRVSTHQFKVYPKMAYCYMYLDRNKAIRVTAKDGSGKTKIVKYKDFVLETGERDETDSMNPFIPFGDVTFDAGSLVDVCVEDVVTGQTSKSYEFKVGEAIYVAPLPTNIKTGDTSFNISYSHRAGIKTGLYCDLTVNGNKTRVALREGESDTIQISKIQGGEIITAQVYDIFGNKSEVCSVKTTLVIPEVKKEKQPAPAKKMPIFKRYGKETIFITTLDDEVKLLYSIYDEDDDDEDDDEYDTIVSDKYTVKMKSSNKNIVKVDKKNRLEGMALGSAVVTATVEETGQQLQWTVVVNKDYHTGKSDNGKCLVGKKESFKNEIKGIKGWKKIKWKSTNKKIIAVSGNRITPKRAGKCKLIGKADGITYYLTCYVETKETQKKRLQKAKEAAEKAKKAEEEKKKWEKGTDQQHLELKTYGLQCLQKSRKN